MDIQTYIEQHSSAEPSYLQEITRSTYLNVLNPRMVSGHIQGRLLSMLSQMIQPEHILELGTFTGYSALCLAEGLTETGRIVTIDHNDELEENIRHNLSLSPLGTKTDLIIGDAKAVLPSLRDIYTQEFGREMPIFDLVFIDADKREYVEYTQLVYPYIRQGGWIIADNTLWDGHIIDPEYDKDKQTKGLREFNDYIAQDTRFEKVILPIRDGLTIIHKL